MKKFKVVPALKKKDWVCMIINVETVDPSDVRKILQCKQKPLDPTVWTETLSRLYAIQRQHKYGLECTKSNFSEAKFQMNYKPEKKFYRGIIKLTHDDKKIQNTIQDKCAHCLCCKLKSSGTLYNSESECNPELIILSWR